MVAANMLILFIITASSLAPSPKELSQSCQLIWELTEKIRLIQETPQSSEPHPPGMTRLEYDIPHTHALFITEFFHLCVRR